MRLAHGSHRAVAVVPRGYGAAGAHRFDRVGSAYDASGEAATALDAAAAAATALDARLEVIHSFYVDRYAYPSEHLASIAADLERGAREDLDEAMEKLPPAIAAEPVFLEGPASDALAAQSERLDLLFAGSRAYGPSRAVMLGSVTFRLLHQASCPVVVLPRGTEPALRRLFDAVVGDRAGT